MNISFTKKQEQYIADQLSSGDYQNASEVVRDAIRLHQLYRERVLRELQREIEIGWESGDSGKTVLDILEELKEKYNSK